MSSCSLAKGGRREAETEVTAKDSSEPSKSPVEHPQQEACSRLVGQPDLLEITASPHQHPPHRLVTGTACFQSTSDVDRRNSIIHEIRVLSPRSSLGGVFYSSSIISIRNALMECSGEAKARRMASADHDGQLTLTSTDTVTLKPSSDKFCLYFKWSQWMVQRCEHSLFLFSPTNRFRQYSLYLADHPYFDYIVLIFISLNCITLAMERPKIPPWSREREFLSLANYVFTIVFAIEMFIKVVAKGLFYGRDAYFLNGWNIMDGSLVGISLFDIFLSFFAQRSPRIFGILRVFRLLRSLRPLR